MAEEEPKKVESESTTNDHPPPPEPKPEPAPAEAPKDVAVPAAEEKSVVTPEEKLDDTKALVVDEKPVEETPLKKASEGSVDRDVELARVVTEKRLSLIKAWEESEKTKADNKAQKKLSAVGAWENRKKASIEVELKKIEEKLEKKKAEYAEKMKNKIAALHRLAQEKRAIIEAKKGEDFLKAEEMSAKYRATGHVPKKVLGCFGG